jgi:hypothetical protein
MAEHVTTFSPRITFVEKTSAEVGDGTDYPMLVNIDQLAEIMYRVKDAWFTAGSLAAQFGIVTTFQGVPNSPLVESINVDDGSSFGTDFFNARAYSANGTIAAPFDSYFATAYSIFGEAYQDCDSELGIWYPDYGLLGAPIVTGGDSEFRCGFSHVVGCSNSDPMGDPTAGLYTVTNINENDPYPDYHTPEVVTVNFTGEVAYVGDNPLNSTTQLYVGVSMEIAANTASTNNTSYALDTGAKFVLGLAGGATVSCKIYSLYESVSASDFILQAQEWWAYELDGEPVWNTATGLPV